MELKHKNRNNPAIAEALLIVPYGIETFLHGRVHQNGSKLLIVPYGIETVYD